MFNDYYVSPDWFALKDFVKALAGDKCEYCRLRPAEHLHHLRYDRFGCEHPADVLNVCKTCHEYLHARLRQSVDLHRQVSHFFHMAGYPGKAICGIAPRRNSGRCMALSPQWTVGARHQSGSPM
jgi:hypothetical protein